ncbi:SARP family transcriptional regulator, partial [Pseudonocardia sp. D17]
RSPRPGPTSSRVWRVRRCWTPAPTPSAPRSCWVSPSRCAEPRWWATGTS